MIERMKAIVGELSQDAPWRPDRSRSVLLVLLPLLGLLGGAVQGMMFHHFLPENAGGDVFVWHFVEFFGWQGAALGVAVAMALGITRHIAGRLALGSMLGTLAIAGVVFVYAGGDPVSILGSAIPQSSARLIETPEGWGAYWGAPMGFVLTLVCHLTRRALSKLRTLIAVLAVGMLLTWRCHGFAWDEWWSVFSSRVPCGNGLRGIRELELPCFAGSVILFILLGEGCLIAELIGPMLSRLPFQSRRLLAGAPLLLFPFFSAVCESMPGSNPTAVEAVTFTADGEFIVSAHRGGVLRLWRIDEDSISEVSKVRVHRGPLVDLQFALSPGMAAVWRSEGKITLWQVGPFRRLHELTADWNPEHTLSLAPDGRTMFVEGTGSFHLWNLMVQADGSVTSMLRESAFEELVPGSRSCPTLFSPKGDALLRSSDRMLYFDRTGTPKGTSPLTRPAHEAIRWPALSAFSRDGSAVAFNGWYGNVVVIRLPSGLVELSAGDAEERITALAFSPDGSEIAAAGDGKVKRWDGASLDCIQPWTPVVKKASIHCLEYFPDGRRLLLGLEDGTLRVLPTQRKDAYPLPAR
jgi:hypothetical protein